MTSQTQPLASKPHRKSPLAAAVIALCLLMLLGFWTLSQPNQLHEDGVLLTSDYVGAAVCHRLDSHSFHVGERAFALCARCSGMYLGVMLIFLFVPIFRRERNAAWPRWPVMVGLLGLIGIMGVDGINSVLWGFGRFYLYQPLNSLRLATGMGAGLAMGTIALIVWAQTMWQQPNPQPLIHSLRELFLLMGAGAIIVILILSNIPPLQYALSIISAVGVVGILSTLYSILIIIAIRRDGSIQRWRSLAAPTTLAFCLTLVQIAVFVTLRLNYTETISGF